MRNQTDEWNAAEYSSISRIHLDVRLSDKT